MGTAGLYHPLTMEAAHPAPGSAGVDHLGFCLVRETLLDFSMEIPIAELLWRILHTVL
jgi:hypothetical protein